MPKHRLWLVQMKNRRRIVDKGDLRVPACLLCLLLH